MKFKSPMKYSHDHLIMTKVVFGVTLFHIILRMLVVVTLVFLDGHGYAVSNLQLKGTKRPVQILPTTDQFLKPMLRYPISALTIFLHVQILPTLCYNPLCPTVFFVLFRIMTSL